MSKRIHNIDLLKGIGVILVIIGHLSIPEPLKNAIYLFHMPLFFLLSGVLWRSKEKKLSLPQYALRLSKTLLYPYLLWNLVEIVIQTGLCLIGRESFHSLALRIGSVLLGVRTLEAFGTQNYLGLLWFFLALFVANIAFFLLKKTKRPFIGVWICTLIGVIYSIAVGERFRLPYCLDVALLSLWFLWLGDLIGQHVTAVSPQKKVLALACTVLCFVIQYFVGVKVDLIRLSISSPLLFYVLSSVICGGLYIGTYGFKAKCAEWVGETSALYLVLQTYGKQLCVFLFMAIRKLSGVDFRQFLFVYFIAIFGVTSILVFFCKKKIRFAIAYPSKNK